MGGGCGCWRCHMCVGSGGCWGGASHGGRGAGWGLVVLRLGLGERGVERVVVR